MATSTFSLTDVSWPGRLGTGAAIALHTTQHLRNTLTLRRMWPYLLLVVLPIAAAAGLARLSIDDSSTIGRFYQHFAMRSLALCALGLGVAAIRDDAEAGALPLLLLKPRAPIALPIGRLIAVALMVCGLGGVMMTGTAGLMVGTLYSPDVGYLTRQVLAALFGGFAYAGIFLGMGAVFKAATGLGLGYLVAVDLLMAQWVDLAAKLSPSVYIGTLVQTLPGKELTAANTAGEIPGALAGLVLLGLAGVGAAVWKCRGDGV